MSDNSNRDQETLSALMDNEATELELRRTLKSVSADKQLAQTWHRYQLAAAAMRRELPPRMLDISARISEAIDQEEAVKPSALRFLQPVGKVAVAATVAVVAVLGVRQFQVWEQPLLDQAGQVQTAATDTATGPQFQLPAGYDLPPVSARTVSAGQPMISEPRPVIVIKKAQRAPINEQEVQAYLNRLMEQHTERSINSGRQGALPYARLPQEATNAP